MEAITPYKDLIDLILGSIGLMFVILTLFIFFRLRRRLHSEEYSNEPEPSESHLEEKPQAKAWQPRPLQSLTPKQEKISTLLEKHGIITRSPAMVDVLKDIQNIAESKVTVLLTGETGVGKSFIAKALHRMSDRKNSKLETFSANQFNDQVVESELFGHAKGAFSGALYDKKGRFENADKSTLFIDEIGDMNVGVQSKILRVIQDGELESVGSTKTIFVDVRLITATNIDLQKSLEEGTFRKDLYYRINKIQLDIPPLRERPEDIIPLSLILFNKHFKNEFKPPEDLFKPFTGLPWYGNVRELESAIESYVIKFDRESPEESLKEHIEQIAEDGKGSTVDDVRIELPELSERVVKRFHSDFSVNKTSEELGLERGTVMAHIISVYLLVGNTLAFDIDKIEKYFIDHGMLGESHSIRFCKEYEKRYNKAVEAGQKIKAGFNTRFRHHDSIKPILIELKPLRFCK